MRTKAERARAAYEKSCRCLGTANRLSEKGDTAKAEIWYERSAQALMTYNELNGEDGYGAKEKL